MATKKYIILIAAAALLLAAGIIIPSALSEPVVRLEITESSLELRPGDSVQLHVKGYTADGGEAAEEQMKYLPVHWRVHADDLYICTVDDSGNLTALKPGVVNVQAYCEKEDLYSRSITVSIKED
ncbi:MAG: hypothetical protein IJV76_01955 [Clostridia bacterium]|nr:hypothetical protein [Clostridia bacterium]